MGLRTGYSFHNCARCGNGFGPARPDAAYCSDACKQKAYRLRKQDEKAKRRRKLKRRK